MNFFLSKLKFNRANFNFFSLGGFTLYFKDGKFIPKEAPGAASMELNDAVEKLCSYESAHAAEQVACVKASIPDVKIPFGHFLRENLAYMHDVWVLGGINSQARNEFIKLYDEKYIPYTYAARASELDKSEYFAQLRDLSQTANRLWESTEMQLDLFAADVDLVLDCACDFLNELGVVPVLNNPAVVSTGVQALSDFFSFGVTTMLSSFIALAALGPSLSAFGTFLLGGVFLFSLLIPTLASTYLSACVAVPQAAPLVVQTIIFKAGGTASLFLPSATALALAIAGTVISADAAIPTTLVTIGVENKLVEVYASDFSHKYDGGVSEPYLVKHLAPSGRLSLPADDLLFDDDKAAIVTRSVFWAWLDRLHPKMQSEYFKLRISEPTGLPEQFSLNPTFSVHSGITSADVAHLSILRKMKHLDKWVEAPSIIS